MRGLGLKTFFVGIFVLLHIGTFSVLTLEPMTTFAAVSAVGFSVFLAGFEVFKCSLYECCTKDWVNLNVTKLQHSLDAKVHGQHLVSPIIVKALTAHQTKSPQKALVLSFHGGTGSGKNFVSRIVVESIYKEGMKSKFVHLFVATHHFPHKSKVETYKDQLRDWIRGNVSVCARSIFIFDEMDKLHPGLIDVIKPYIDFYEEINGVDYRKATFIFLSNTAASAVNAVTLQYFNMNKKRTEITYKEMENVIKLESYNQDSGLWHSSLIEKDLVNVFVPFLPMEREHVKQCIRDDMRLKKHHIEEKRVTAVADELQYFPSSSQIFSKTGCKRVSDKVNLVMLDS